ncbi:ATP-binding protein, partial [Enterococcus hirae]
MVNCFLYFDFVILDEFGYLLFSVLGGVLFFYLLSKFYECISVIIIINLSFSEWVIVFGDVKMIMVFFDWFIYYCYIL